MASYLKVLVKYQANLVSSLSDANLLELSSDLYRDSVICKEASDKFASLDPDPAHLEPALKVRYLLKLIYERVREDGRLYEKFVRVLSRLRGEVKLVCQAMKKEEVEHEDVECASCNWSQQNSDIFLTVQYVPFLVELIVAGSHKWEEIGVALGVPEYVREECRSAGSNPLKLSKLLSAWISGQYNDAKATTLNSLKTVLDDGLVKLADLAQNLDKFSSLSEHSSFSQLSSQDLCLIKCQSGDTEVAEGKSTLLEVQGNCSLYEAYQWSKDGEPIANGTDFSGVYSSILYINRASQCTEGKYSCCVSRGSETVCSDEICLSVIYPPEKIKLIEFYSFTKREGLQEFWPPISHSIFTNLFTISQKEKSTNRCDYYTIRGDVDDIPESKEVAEYEEVFREYREGALVLVEGRPGSGKTTLVHKLTKDWAEGKKVLLRARMVFLVHLKLLDVSGKDKSLLNMLQIFYGENLSKNIEHDLQENKGKGACFILDGLDEYPFESKKLLIDQLLFDETFLPHSMVIVASRPVATEELRTFCNTRIEVVGLTKDQIYSYVKSYPFNGHPTIMACKMIDFLDQHPNVLHMCYLPIHAAMICLLFSQLEGNIPQRETQIYEQLTITALLKQKACRGGKLQVRSLEDLDSEEKELLKCVCKLAFDMIISSQLVVSKSNALTYLSSDSALLTTEHASKYYGSEDFYTFNHLPFQEFLAAVYIREAELEDEELIEDDRLKNVWKFYSGLSKSIANISCVKKVISRFSFDRFCQLQLAYESQQVELCDYVIEELVRVSGHTTSTDLIALGYLISTTTKLLNRIVWDPLNYDCEGVKLFLSMVSDRKLQSIKCLEVGGENDNNFKALNYLLLHLPFLEQLDMSRVCLNKSRIEYLTSEVTLPHLKVLKLSIPLVPPCSHPERILKLLTFNSKSMSQVFYKVHYSHEVNLVVWSKILRYVFGCQTSPMSWLHLYNIDNYPSLPHERLSHCTEVVLVNCCIGDEGAEILANALNTSVLENLVLDFNRINDVGAVALAVCLARCSVVQEVSIECNCIGDSGATELADALVYCSSLRRLDLQGNSLGDKGAVAIAKATESLPRLDLYLCNANVTEEGIERVLEYRARTRIRSMEFTSSWDRVSEGGIDTLKRALYCGYLPALKLSSSNISVVEMLVAEQECVMNVSGIEYVISDDTVPTLCCIINHLQKLELITIELCSDHFSSSSGQCLSDSLRACKSLHSLTLHGSEVGIEFPHSLLDVVRCCSPLRSLSLYWGDIDSHGVSIIFGNHESFINLHTLKLDGCSIGSDGAQALSRVLMHCKKLCCLDLSDYIIDDIEILALAEGLKDHTSLLELNMRGIGITSESMTVLSQVIKSNHLQHLNLGANRITEYLPVLVDVICHDSLQILELQSIGLESEDTAILSKGLEKCTQLVELDISSNDIDSDGVVCLAEGLQHCTNLQVLELGLCYITSDGVTALCHIMSSCKFLRTLGLSTNRDIGVDGVAALIGGWQHKSVLTLKIDSCFDDIHELALENGEKCCSSCDHLLELFYNNDYVHIPTLLKLVSPEFR